jgi:hypothetical protein
VGFEETFSIAHIAPNPSKLEQIFDGGSQVQDA